MSIFHDERRFSDDESIFNQWINEVKRECRGDYYCPTPPDDYEEMEDEDD